MGIRHEERDVSCLPRNPSCASPSRRPSTTSCLSQANGKRLVNLVGDARGAPAREALTPQGPDGQGRQPPHQDLRTPLPSQTLRVHRCLPSSEVVATPRLLPPSPVPWMRTGAPFCMEVDGMRHGQTSTARSHLGASAVEVSRFHATRLPSMETVSTSSLRYRRIRFSDLRKAYEEAMAQQTHAKPYALSYGFDVWRIFFNSVCHGMAATFCSKSARGGRVWDRLIRARPASVPCGLVPCMCFCGFDPLHRSEAFRCRSKGAFAAQSFARAF